MSMERDAVMRKLREAAKQARAKREAEAARREELLKHTPLAKAVAPTEGNTFGNITFNESQMAAVTAAREGKELILTGAAGTGKTTAVKAMMHYLIQNASLEHGCKPEELHPKTMLICSFTNRAVKNIAKAVDDVPGASRFCATIHRFLEFQPTTIEVPDESSESGFRESFRFMPSYDKENQIPETKLIIVEESSMVSVDLFKMLVDACPNAKFIFLGDLNQLPPVMGDAILGHKLNELPVFELTEVYRQAMDSPIIAFQHNFTLKGVLPGDTQLAKITEESNGQLNFHPLRNEKKIDPELLAQALAVHMCTLYENNKYHPSNSIILIPYNKGFGSIHMNKHIAQYFSTKVNMEPTFEIIAGMEKQYFAVGDFVIFNKEEYVIESITTNPAYHGTQQPRMESITMDRFGFDPNDTASADMLAKLDMGNSLGTDLDMLLKTTNGDLQEDLEELKAQSSHKIKLRRPDWMDGSEGPELTTRGDINGLDFGYAITVHKSQGSEWERVFLITSQKHNVMLSRELLYTGMTRAKKQLTVFFSESSGPGRKNSSICKAIKSQRIRGNTWREKARHFFAKQEQYQAKMNDTYEEEAEK